MARWCRRALLAAIMLVAAAGAALAQETGSVSGYVFDQDGAPVEGATVRISGDQLPAGRTTVSRATGEFQFPLLLPGSYTVEASKSGLGSTKRSVVVEVARDSQLDVVLGVKVEENVQVTATVPMVDMRSTEVNFNYKREQFESLPLPRTYAGLFQLIPGVADNQSFAPNGGASRQDNTFLLDGVNITNPGFGYLSTDVNEFDIVEFNVKRGAITAEFGRSSGFVTNAITRSGSNQLHGGVRFEAIPSGLIAESKGDIKNNEDRWVPAYGVGGPLVRDHLFWYTSGRFYRSTISDRVNNIGPLPDREEEVNELFGKITAQPNPSHQIHASYRHLPRHVDFDGIGANDSPEVATNGEGTNRVAAANWNWFIGSRTYLDVKYLRLDEENEAVAVTQLGERGVFDPTNLAAMGQFFDPVLNRTVGGASLARNVQNYRRDEVRATLSQFFDIKGSSHQFKAGFSFEDSEEDLTRISNAWGTVARIQANTRIQATYYPQQPSQLSKARSYSLFLQDDITFGPRLTANVGLLVNRDEFAQDLGERNTFLTFNFDQQLQPRLGVNFNVRQGAGDKVYANYGRYYGLDQKSSARSLAPQRLFTLDATFDNAGNLLSEVRAANTTGKVLLDMDPTYTDEFLVGYATPLGGPWSIDVFFMFRDTDNFIEDYPSVLPFSSFVVDNIPAADRRYRALTFELSRRLQDRWSLTASYAWSKLYGNFDLDYAFGTQVFNTSSLIEDGPGSFVEDRNRQGVLSQDRTHVLKVFATYNPIDRLTVGGYLRSQSGTPWEARGLPWGSTATLLRYLEPAGTRRTDAWTNLDLLLGYRVPLGPRASVLLEGRLLNVFDTQTEIRVDQRQYLDGRIRAFTEPPGPTCDRACYTDLMVQGTTSPNPNFGKPILYAPPRRLLLTARVDF